MTSTLTPTRGHLVDGHWVVGKPLETIPIVDPASGQRIATKPAGDRADAREAAAAARRAVGRRPAGPPGRRRSARWSCAPSPMP